MHVYSKEETVPLLSDSRWKYFYKRLAVNSELIPYLKGQHVLTPEERRAAGKALRSTVPRTSHAEWAAAPDRPDPISLLEESDRTRLASLVPVRYGRMLTSPFAFLRGSAAIMAHDLLTMTTTGLLVQVASDIFLGWARIGSTDYYIRQLHDWSLSASVEDMSVSDFITSSLSVWRSLSQVYRLHFSGSRPQCYPSIYSAVRRQEK